MIPGLPITEKFGNESMGQKILVTIVLNISKNHTSKFSDTFYYRLA